MSIRNKREQGICFRAAKLLHRDDMIQDAFTGDPYVMIEELCTKLIIIRNHAKNLKNNCYHISEVFEPSKVSKS